MRTATSGITTRQREAETGIPSTLIDASDYVSDRLEDDGYGDA